MPVEGVAAWVRSSDSAGQHPTQPRAALLGHAQLATTAIDAEVVGKEERDIAARMGQ